MIPSKSESSSAKPSHSSRRNFLKQTGLTAGVAATAGGFVPYFTTAPRAAAEDKNSRLNVGSIGTSIYTDRYTGTGDRPGRGAVIGHQAGERGNMVAVADVNTKASAFFAERYNGQCQQYQDYEELLAREDIDAVTIGTPDHWHTKIAIDAMRAGKHVYCEKPLTLTIKEGQQLIKVAKETGMVFQVGTQQRSEYDGVFLNAVAIARSGMLGDKLHCLISVGPAEKGGPFKTQPVPEHLDWDKWLGQAPQVAYCPQRADFDYRWWLEYSGGQVTDWGCHHGDIALLALGLGETGPTKIYGKGSYPDVENGFNVATTFDCNYEFEGGHTARLYSGKNELIISGDRGKIRVNRGGLTGTVAKELGVQTNGSASPENASEKVATPSWLSDAVTELYHGKVPGSHMGNFFECIKDGGQPVSDVVSSHRSASLCHLANIAMRLGRPLDFDPATETFPNDPEAQAMTSRPQRDQYAIDVEV